MRLLTQNTFISQWWDDSTTKEIIVFQHSDPRFDQSLKPPLDVSLSQYHQPTANESTETEREAANRKLAMKVDRISAVLFPGAMFTLARAHCCVFAVIFAIFNLIYWLYYLQSAHAEIWPTDFSEDAENRDSVVSKDTYMELYGVEEG